MRVEVFLLLVEIPFREQFSKRLLEQFKPVYCSEADYLTECSFLRFHQIIENSLRKQKAFERVSEYKWIYIIKKMSLLAIDNTRKINSAIPFQRGYNFHDFYEGGRYDVTKMMHFFKNEGRLQKQTVLELLRRAVKILQMQANLLKIKGQSWIIGDIHGQFYDFIRLCEVKFDLQKDTLLFLGDYVDRGNFSIEVMMMLVILKLNSPKRVFLLRGNHECQQMTSYFNFQQECVKKYDQEVYLGFVDLFNCLPLAAILNHTFLCLHGGLSTNLVHIKDITRINRFQEIASNGLFCDLMWADPTLEPNGELKRIQADNIERGCSYIFGKQLAGQFLKSNHLQCVIRGHQAQQKGYRLFHWAGQQVFPCVITVFSAPNYCDFYNNKGACLKINQKQLIFEQYSEVEHPYTLPDFMDIFQWSFPFVAEKISEMMFHLLLPDRNTNSEENHDVSLIMKIEIMRKILNGHKQLANTNILYTNLSGRSLDNMLAHDEQAIQCIKNREQNDNFATKRQIDLKYQKRPLISQYNP